MKPFHVGVFLQGVVQMSNWTLPQIEAREEDGTGWKKVL